VVVQRISVQTFQWLMDALLFVAGLSLAWAALA
jgi:hypothetical protein